MEIYKKEVEFGLSSLLFLIPVLYAYCTLDNSFMVWKIVVTLLPLSSYLCNRYPTQTLYQLYDHTVIILLSMTYICYKYDYYYLNSIVLVLYFIEIVKTNRVSYTAIISFILLNACAWSYFTRIELYIAFLVFLIGCYCKLKRCTTCDTYPYYTSLWHLCCTILLLLAIKTLHSTFPKTLH